jgi:hypothetical protein
MGDDLHIVEKNLRETCSICGRSEEFFPLPGRPENLCLACSADVATVAVLRTEIDAATYAGQDANNMLDEFWQLSRRLLTRAQSVDALGRW